MRPKYGVNPTYYDNHKFFLAIGKNTNDEYKFIFYNFSVKYNADINDVIACADYTLNYNFDDLLDMASTLKNQYYGDYVIELINSKKINISVSDMTNGDLVIYSRKDNKKVESLSENNSPIINIKTLVDE